MLQRIRDNVQGWVAKVIVAIIVVPFAAFGINAFFGGGGDPDVAKVNGQGIKSSQLSEAIYLQKREILNRGHGKVSADQLDDAVLRKSAMKSLIDRTLMERAAGELGMAISAAMTDQYIRQMDQFKEDGKFSQTRMELLLRGQGMKSAMFKQNIHNALLLNQLVSFYTNATIVTHGQLGRAALVLAQKRDVSWVRLPIAAARKQVTVSDDELHRYYDVHRAEFKTLEKISVNYIEIRLKDFYPDIPGKELHSAYEDEVRSQQAKVQRRASHILITTSPKLSDVQARAKAEQIRQKIKQGADFAQLARNYSADQGSADQGGDLGYTDGTVFPVAFEKALAGLKQGQVSQPVKTDAGWHLIELTDVRKGQVESYAEVKDRLHEQLQRMKAKNTFATKEERLADLSFNAPDLASVGKQMSLKVQTSPLFTRDGTGKGLLSNQQVLKAAFSKAVMQEGANSEMVELPNDHAVVVRLAQHKLPEQLSFNDVREQIYTGLIEKKAQQRLRDRASALVAQLGQGKDFKSLAEATGVEYHTVDAVARGRGDDLPPAVAAEAFALPLVSDTANAGTAQLDNGDVSVVAVNRILPGSVDQLSLAEQHQLRRLLKQYRASRHGRAYQQGLHMDAAIKIL